MINQTQSNQRTRDLTLQHELVSNRDDSQDENGCTTSMSTSCSSNVDLPAILPAAPQNIPVLGGVSGSNFGVGGYSTCGSTQEETSVSSMDWTGSSVIVDGVPTMVFEPQELHSSHLEVDGCQRVEQFPNRDWIEILAKVDELPSIELESDLSQRAEESGPVRDWIELLAKVDDLHSDGCILSSTTDPEPGQLGSETNLDDYAPRRTTTGAADLISRRAGVEFPADAPTIQWPTGLVTTRPFNSSREVRIIDLNNCWGFLISIYDQDAMKHMAISSDPEPFTQMEMPCHRNAHNVCKVCVFLPVNRDDNTKSKVEC